MMSPYFDLESDMEFTSLVGSTRPPPFSSPPASEAKVIASVREALFAFLQAPVEQTNGGGGPPPPPAHSRPHSVARTAGDFGPEETVGSLKGIIFLHYIVKASPRAPG